MDTPASDHDQSWGAKVNHDRYGPWRAKDWPAWATKAQQKAWGDPGLVLWTTATQQITHLTPAAALHVLDELRTTTAWEEQGLTVSAMRMPLPGYTHAPPPRPIAHTAMPLTADQARVLFDLLLAHEVDLRRMAASTMNLIQSDLSAARADLHRIRRRNEAARVDLAARAFPWTVEDTRPNTVGGAVPWPIEEATTIWTCDRPPNRGTVYLAIENLVWQGCIERPHRFKYTSGYFCAFTEALAWVEQELIGAAAADAATPPKAPTPPPELSLATLTPAHRKRLARFWIAPRALEPTHVTYRVVIYVAYKLISHKSIELSFGEQIPVDEQYPTPMQVARTFVMDVSRMDIRAMVGGRLYRITSLATYAQDSTARAQAQQVWDRSTIATAYRAQHIVGAAYGIEEVETMYRSWIGGYGDWRETPQDRSAFLADKAFDLTLIHALDVKGYRAANRTYTANLDDAELIEELHYERTQSEHIPIAARAESEQWLKDHGHPDIRHYVDPWQRKIQAKQAQRKR